MKTQQYISKFGVEVELREREVSFVEPLRSVFQGVDEKKGGVFSSGFDFPGRHSRWDTGFINPALEFISHGPTFTFNGLHEQGSALLPMLEQHLKQEPHIQSLELGKGPEGLFLKGRIKESTEFFTEEERSRQPSVFSVLRALIRFLEPEEKDLGLASHFGLYGAFGYDLVLQFEPLKQKHTRNPDEKDCHLYLPLELTVVDRKRELAWEISYSIKTPQGWTSELSKDTKSYRLSSGSGDTEITCDHRPGEFAEKVNQVMHGAKQGDYFEVVLSQSFSTRFSGKPTELFQRIASINPSPYMFLLQFGDEQLIGASPEIYVRVTGKRYETCPIAGTVRRGATALEDADQVLQLISSKKDESELTMCTDVDRNDMARVCVPGSVRVIGRRQLEFYSHLIHTVDHLEGELRPEFDALDAFQTHMWACTVTGAPKPAAMQEIENLENSPRGWYSGAVGYLSFSGNLNTGITLRSAKVKGGRATVRAGATLLYGSDPALEEQETRTKAAAFLSALAAADPVTSNSKKSTIEIGFSPLEKKVLLVDYQDSFVHNLAAYLRELGCSVQTLRAGFPKGKLKELSPDLVLLSPGPGTPEQFGVPNFVGELAAMRMPTFGVCLGHQAIGQHFGATLNVLPIPYHGKPSLVFHNQNELFSGVAQSFEVGRYHSLYLVPETVPSHLEILASVEPTDEIPIAVPMAIRHRELPIAGVQFHPESLMTLKEKTGHRLLHNAIRILSAG